MTESEYTPATAWGRRVASIEQEMAELRKRLGMLNDQVGEALRTRCDGRDSGGARCTADGPHLGQHRWRPQADVPEPFPFSGGSWDIWDDLRPMRTPDPTDTSALVTATCGGVRYVLLVERGDGAGWAMPGGAIESGESPDWAAVRELGEETGLISDEIYPARFVYDEPRWVPDSRGSMEAWAVTVVARCDLGEVDALPEVRGGDDARDARWWRIARGEFLTNIFPAHREILGALR